MIGHTTFLTINNSYHISDAEEEDMVLRSHHLRLLLGCNNNEEGEGHEIYCNACRSFKTGTIYYFCNDCQNSYHKECVESPPIFISPCHPKYPLQLFKYYRGVTVKECHSCGMGFSGLFYYSSKWDLFLDPVCANKKEFSAINNLKRHEHTLHYFPKQASVTCDVCASNDNKCCFYICLQCDFVVHRTCIDLPRVILIPFHNHRLSFAYSLPSEDWSCGVCRRKMNENYGAYSCTKSCAYAVHSRCATQRDVWDGKELEDEPEEVLVHDNFQSFEEIGDGVIRHFSHAHHHMRLVEDDSERVFDGKQVCQACMLPLYDGNVYSCMQCDFVLHEECANLSRKKYSVVHPHRLILKPTPPIERYLACPFCGEFSCGFRYMCVEGCDSFYVDVVCASLPDLLNHPSHPHPLFLIYRQGTSQSCSICFSPENRCLNCVKCNFILCFRCANLPYKTKHEHDDHILTLTYEKNATTPYWCQVCEKLTNPRKGYYACSECGVTFHIDCILGKNPYMKAGQTLYHIDGLTIELIPNTRLSRPLCKRCHRRCQYKIMYKTSRGDTFCTFFEVKATGKSLAQGDVFCMFFEVRCWNLS